MSLFLQTESNPGEAFFGPAPSSGGGSLLLLVPSAVGGGNAPVLDPAGRQNICYTFTGTLLNPLEVTLPPITPTLPPTWRITWSSAIAQPTSYLLVSPSIGNSILSDDGDGIRLGAIGESYITFWSATFVHDGIGVWAVFRGVFFG